MRHLHLPSGPVVGIDNCRGGWVAVCARPEGVSWAVHPTFEALAAALADAAVLAVDIPIGLTDAGPRACDVSARATLAGSRKASVFPAPVRAVLGAATYAEANARHRAADGRGLSAQSFGIVPKMAEVDVALRADPALAARTVEVHPEVSFAAMAGRTLSLSKKKLEGRAERLQVLSAAFGDAPELALSNRRTALRGAQPDDVLDAFAALWSGVSVAQGTARTLPPDPPLDAYGLTMAIRA